MNDIIKIELFGETYQFMAEADVKDAQEIADFLMTELDRVEERLSGSGQNISKTAKLLLATMDISNRLFELRKVHEELVGSMEDRSKKLLERLSSVDSGAERSSIG